MDAHLATHKLRTWASSCGRNKAKADEGMFFPQSSYIEQQCSLLAYIKPNAKRFLSSAFTVSFDVKDFND
ncbi:hypothetical protein C9J12_28605 [Photobacterium frigidiphilum]|uniref:Uncharacterized protein n=1 Tax=Photobacterium frigidiphilum TaxID=264736 RepID=A0A2T3J6A7_9GAMM|nr:hypothetical protein C9J12_28605 [Photobacterium frigidiphilum]